MVGGDGTVLRDAEGKTRWQPLISFTDKGVRDNWSAQIVDAVHKAHPDALQGPGAGGRGHVKPRLTSTWKNSRALPPRSSTCAKATGGTAIVQCPFTLARSAPVATGGSPPRCRTRRCGPSAGRKMRPSPLGLAAGKVAGVDIDILIQATADRVVFAVEQAIGRTPLARIGLAPKILLAFRCDTPFSKLSTGTFLMPDDTEAKVELLADGQQFVVDGIHPDTGRAYFWPAGSPETVPLDELPAITLEQAQAIVAEARAILVANGGVEKKTPPRERKTTSANADSFFAKVNEAALRNLAAWVKPLFPKAVYHPATGAWRVASKDRGRPDLEEDISIHPEGIQDFGLEKPLTPIDVVIEHGDAPDAVQAALRLCGHIGIDPGQLGWHPPGNGAGGQKNEPTGADEEREKQKRKPNGPDPGDEPDTEKPVLRLRYGFDTTTPQPIGTIVEGLLHAGSVTLIYGPPKSGKSFLATDLFLTIAAREKQWMDHAIVRSGPVLCVACEGHAGFWKRTAAAAKTRGWDRTTFPEGFILATGRPMLIRADARGMTYAPDPSSVLAALEEAKQRGLVPVAIIIDTVFRSFGAGNVNASPDMNVYLASIAVLTDQGYAVALVHHEIKSGGTPAGSVSLIGGADTIVHVWRESETSNRRFWQVEMAKDDAETEPRAFALEVVPIGLDPDGRPASSCVIHDAGAAPDAATKNKRGRPPSENSDAAILANLIFDELCALLADPNEGQDVAFHPQATPIRAVSRTRLRGSLNRAGILDPVTDEADRKRITANNDNQVKRAINRLKNQRKVIANEQWIGLAPQGDHKF